MTGKPANPRIRDFSRAPVFWAALDGPRRTFASDTGDAADLTGCAPAGVRASGATWGTSPFGPCLTFDGTASGYAEFGSVDKLPQGTAAYTIACTCLATWSNPNVWQDIVQYGSPQHYAGIGQVNAVLMANMYNSWVQGPDPSVGVWRRVAVTWGQGSPSPHRTYIDGRLAGEAASVYGAVEGKTLRLGGPVIGTDSYFKGSIADVQVFDYLFTAEQALADAADPWRRLRERPRADMVLASAGASTSRGRTPRWIPPRRHVRARAW